jgi:predicted O-methyltransferase YrrM
MTRINVCMPCYGAMPPETVFSLISLTNRCRKAGVLGEILSRNFLYVDQARNALVRETLEDDNATHLLALDADMVWPSDMALRLLARSKAVVGGNYFSKTPPYDIIAGHWCADGVHMTRLQELPSDCFRVGVLGMGATLIETRILRDMRQHFGDEHWFRTTETGEDLWFFSRCRQMGVPVFLDASINCGHLAQVIVTDDYWRAARGQLAISKAADPAECNFADLYATVVESLPERPCILVEVGSFLGASATVMARIIQKADRKDVRFFCVDHFKGSADQYHQALARQEGGGFRHRFEQNLTAAGVRDLIEIVEGDSAASAVKFQDGCCDFVFIDAEHTYDAVKADIQAWLPKVRPGGLIAGHDFDWAGVRQAVQELLPDAKQTSLVCWQWRKSA